MSRFLTATFLTGIFGCPMLAAEPIEVTIVVVLASEKHKEVNEKLKDLAEKVQAKSPKITGFTLDKVITESIPMGKSRTIKLPGDVEMVVSVHAQLDEDGCITLTVKPPTLGEIKYQCKCGKFFPIITEHQPNPKSDEKMILAIMSKPCKGKK